MEFDWTRGALAEGLRCYAAGEFFAAHEAWESVWLTAPQPEKTFLQGVIQVAAALEHQRRNNSLGIARGHWERLLVCLLGFVVARLVVMRLTRTAEKPTYLAQAASDAP